MSHADELRACGVRRDASIAAADAVALVKTEQRALGRSRPITLRGQWAGWFHCDAGTPRVELVRKLAAYGTLRVVSAPTAGWTWTVARTEKWFSEPGTDTGRATTLIKPIEHGLARAIGAAYDTSFGGSPRTWTSACWSSVDTRQ